MTPAVTIVVLTFVMLTLVTGVAVARAHEAHRVNETWRRLRLTFPRDTQAQAVRNFLVGLGTLTPPPSTPWQLRPAVILEVTASSAGIRHHVVASPNVVEAVQAHIRAALPGVRVAEEPIEPHGPHRDHGLVHAAEGRGVELVLTNERRPLRAENPEAVTTAVLAAMQPLRRGGGETVILQCTLAGARSQSPVGLRRANGLLVPRHVEKLTSVLGSEAASRSERRQKLGQPLLLGVLRVSAVGSSGKRAEHLVRQVTSSLRMTTVADTRLRARVLPSAVAYRRVADRRLPVLSWPSRYSVDELVALTALPISSPQLPGLTLGTSRLLAPSSAIPTHGCVIGTANFPGMARPVAISPAARRTHTLVIGGTGVGKTTLVSRLVTDDVTSGRNVVVIAPEEDLIEDCLDRIPRDRFDDVIVVDPTDHRPVGVNLLADAKDQPDLVTDQVVGAFRHIFAASWGPRLEDLLRGAVATLVHQPGATIAEIPLVLTDYAYRARLVKRIGDPVLFSWHEQLAEWSPEQKAVSLPAVTNKLRAVLLRRQLRNVLGQSQPRWNLREAIDGTGLVFMSLAKGRIGDDGAGLAAAFVLATLWNAVQGRAALSPSRRRPVHIYIDELVDFVGLPTRLDVMLAQARGLNCAVTLAAQHLAQLPSDLRAAALANCRTKICFGVSADDARVMAREFGGDVVPDDLMRLEPFEAVAGISTGPRTLPPVTVTTLPLSASRGSSRAVRRLSRERYGVDRGEIERALRDRGDPSPPDTGPIGIRRRPS